jgi:lysophospholipid acyltransferase (LPLAT)-like uncharacterized protein
MQKLPIGIQSFRRIREEGYLYVDKTKEIHQLLNAADYMLCCRPPRFGKSLLLNTIAALYGGEKELFKGLWIENQWDWDKRAVLHIDFNRMDFLSNSLEKSLLLYIQDLANDFGFQIEAPTAKTAVEQLIEKCAEDKAGVIVLIDDYEKALTDFMSDSEQKKWHAQLLQNFYGCLKAMNAHIHKVVIMGSSKHGANQLFADLDGLRDLSHKTVAAEICGFSPKELQSAFSPYIAALAQKTGMAATSLMAKIRFWYNGYSWDGEHKICNPFSVLNFFADEGFHNYWHEMFSNQKLLALLEEQKILPYELERFESDGLLLENDEIDLPNSLAMLFQSGQLSIKSLKKNGLNNPDYIIGFPNQEVRLSLMQHLLAEYCDMAMAMASHRFSRPMKQSLAKEDWEEFIEGLNQLLQQIPTHLFNQKAEYFYSIMYVLLNTSSWLEFAEIQKDLSRMDLVLRNATHTYIIELNIDRSAKEAITQLRMMQYPAQYSHSTQKTILIGISYYSATDNIGDWTTETLAKN